MSEIKSKKSIQELFPKEYEQMIKEVNAVMAVFSKNPLHNEIRKELKKLKARKKKHKVKKS